VSCVNGWCPNRVVISLGVSEPCGSEEEVVEALARRGYWQMLSDECSPAPTSDPSDSANASFGLFLRLSSGRVNQCVLVAPAARDRHGDLRSDRTYAFPLRCWHGGHPHQAVVKHHQPD
jgi:hypothetical protein